MKDIPVTIKYKAGHSYDFTYAHQDIFCPQCGKQSVWMELSGGDYYQGPTHVCVECNHYFTIPSLGEANDQDLQVIQQIKDVLK